MAQTLGNKLEAGEIHLDREHRRPGLISFVEVDNTFSFSTAPKGEELGPPLLSQGHAAISGFDQAQ